MKQIIRPLSKKHMMQKYFLPMVLVIVFAITTGYSAGHVIIVVIDGARYSETFGANDKYIPVMWNTLRSQGTIFTEMRNEGKTTTCPGHSSILTGVWQFIANDGTERPHNPTIFEYFRKQTSLPAQSCFVVSGKKKLNALTFSTDQHYGAAYGASFLFGDTSDIETWEKVSQTIDRYHPQLMMVNLPQVDLYGHENNWLAYIGAIHRADSIVGLLWNKIQSDTVYRNTTTMFVTNDHGRHDDQHGGFRDHGDACEGCRHILLLALGPQFAGNAVVADTTLQVDLAPTAAYLLGIKIPAVQGTNILEKQLHHR